MKKEIELECRNPKCVEQNNGMPYRWTYKGKSKFPYTSCPVCHASVKKIPAQKT